MSTRKKPIVNPLIVLREEFDDWAILFDPDTGNAYGLNPVSVLIWKCLDGKNTIDDIVAKIKSDCTDVPDNAADFVNNFIDELIENGLAGYDTEYA